MEKLLALAVYSVTFTKMKYLPWKKKFISEKKLGPNWIHAYETKEAISRRKKRPA
jgi:hypothetical protein